MVLWAGDRARVKIYAHVRLPMPEGGNPEWLNRISTASRA
jgi:hypothetical protein